LQKNLMDGFQRDIAYRLGREENGGLRLFASMRDRYHDILLAVAVDEKTLLIEEITVEFRRCPTGTCALAAQRLRQLAGVPIAKGLNRRIVEALGGESGCGNLRTLLLGLLPLAMNLKAAEGFTQEDAMLDNVRSQLLGTCAGYPQQGDQA
jgi:hypothetical protein